MKILYQADKVSVCSTLQKNLLIPKSFKQLPFEKIKNGILGKNYELSIVLVGNTKVKSLNFKYRKKDQATDVLSFEVDKNCGEIFISPAKAKTKSRKTDMNFENYLLFLVIHACFHLKGFEHSDKMEKYEFSHYNRYRHRYL